MNILVTHTYFLYFDPKQWALSKPYPPLATLLAVSCIRDAGMHVDFFDVSFQKNPRAIADTLAEKKPEVLVIYDDGFNYLSKMCLTNMREAAFVMCSLASEKGIRVIVSSSDSTDHATSYHEKGAEVVLLGEAEDSLLEVLRCWRSGKSLESVSGISYVENGKAVNNGKRPVRTDLDSLPFAAWDLLDVQSYRNAWKKHGYFSINMATTRGCPYKCNWCAKPIYGNRYNSRSPQKVVEELKWMRSLFAYDHVWFSDDIFGLRQDWVKEFRTELQRQRIGIRYKIQSRADLLLKDETIRELAESGAEEIWIGAESGSQKILDAMDKGITVAQIYEATKTMRHHGIRPCFFLQFGYLGENQEDIEATLNMVFELMPADIGVSVSYPLPGTKFYEKVKAQLTEKTNWSDSDELLLMYESTFSPEYYRALHRFLHKRFRAEQSVRQFHKLLRLKSFHPKHSFSFLYFKPASWWERRKMKRLQREILQSRF